MFIIKVIIALNICIKYLLKVLYDKKLDYNKQLEVITNVRKVYLGLKLLKHFPKLTIVFVFLFRKKYN